MRFEASVRSSVAAIKMKARALPSGQFDAGNLIVDERRHHLETRPAEQHRRCIGVHRQMKHKIVPAAIAGQRQRQGDAAKGAQGTGAHAERRLIERLRNALDDALQGLAP